MKAIAGSLLSGFVTAWLLWQSPGAVADAASTNRPPRVAAAVLPFRNATGDASQEHWSVGFQALVAGRLAYAPRVDLRVWDEIHRALTNAAWVASRAVDVQLAAALASQLETDAILWGQYSRADAEWLLRVWVWRRESATELATVDVREASLNELLIRASLELADKLGVKIPQEYQERWRRRGTSSNAAWDKLAQVLGMERTNAPVEVRERMLRQLVAEHTEFVTPRADLAELLMRTGRISEAETEYRKLTQSIPEWCGSHLMLAQIAQKAEKMEEAEREVKECLRVHPGCPAGAGGLFVTLRERELWQELREILEMANAKLPDEPSTMACLASARLHCADREGAERLLRALGNTSREGLVAHVATLDAAIGVGLTELMSAEIRWLQTHAASDAEVAEVLGSVDATFSSKKRSSTTNPLRPRAFTSEELSRELGQRLTPDERSLAINPVEVTSDITLLSTNLTHGLTNEYLRAFVLFCEVARRGRGDGEPGIRSAQKALQVARDPQTRFSCQEFAKLFVALARASGLPAWLTHIDVDEDGRTAYHDCAALFLAGDGFLVDPTLGDFPAYHRQYRVLDDVQAIAHQAMQRGGGADLDRLRVGRKLDPEDAWTQLQWVRALAQAGFTDNAEAELSKLGTNHTGRWDYHFASAFVQASKKAWQPALAALQQALLLSPSNPIVHLEFASIYNSIEDYGKAREHSEAAARLDAGNSFGLKSRENVFSFQVMQALEQAHSPTAENRDLLRQKAQAGDAAAQFGLAKLLFESEPPQIEEGLAWLRKAAEQGDSDIQQACAHNVLAAKGPSGAEEALKWYNRSAQQGNQEAQLRLGALLYDGKLTNRDVVTGCKWVILAARQGSKEAEGLLQEIELFVEKSQLTEARRRAAAFREKKESGPAP